VPHRQVKRANRLSLKILGDSRLDVEKPKPCIG
jgi:hypothetical protein